jgi:hypothetical protein
MDRIRKARHITAVPPTGTTDLRHMFNETPTVRLLTGHLPWERETGFARRARQ